jgi:type I restriction enzyme, S subunit
MKKYDSYKDSFVEWVGEIPSHWKLIKLHTLVTSQMLEFQDGNHGGLHPLTEEFLDKGVPFIKPKDIQNESIYWCTCDRLPYERCEQFRIGFSHNDDVLLVNRGGSIGKVVYVSDYDNEYPYFIINPQVTYMRGKNELLSKYVFYTSLSDIFRCSVDLVLGHGSTFPFLGLSNMGDFEMVFPPLSEQKQIVSFLDTKTSLIDSLIEKTQKKIELLKEKRTSLINEVVTKGLNPNVEMKDSGVEWIGEIPSHWVESQFKYYIKLRHGHQFRDGDFTDEGIKIIKITQLDKGGFLNLSNCSTIDKERLTDFEDILIFENDILMCLTGGTIGKIIKVGKVDEPLLQNYRVGHFSPIDSKSMGNNYMFYLMSSEVIVGQIFYDVRETGQPNIGMEDMNRMRICIPPISEQQKIVEYLDEQTQLIDNTTSIEEKRIELLKEYRQSLISEVVTGKRKVV